MKLVVGRASWPLVSFPDPMGSGNETTWSHDMCACTIMHNRRVPYGKVGCIHTAEKDL